jgi:type IV secretory pathway VirB3-like protein
MNAVALAVSIMQLFLLFLVVVVPIFLVAYIIYRNTKNK